MREIKNNSSRMLEYEEHLAILECSKILHKAFKKRVHSCQINPQKDNPNDIWGIAFAFDMYGLK